MSGLRVWLTSQMPHSTAKHSHQQVIATPASAWLIAGCKPNAHIRKSQGSRARVGLENTLLAGVVGGSSGARVSYSSATARQSR